MTVFIIIAIVIVSVLYLGWFLDKKLSRGGPQPTETAPTLYPCEPIPDKPIYISNSLPIRRFGEWYNLRVRHIKKYKRLQK